MKWRGRSRGVAVYAWGHGQSHGGDRDHVTGGSANPVHEREPQLVTGVRMGEWWRDDIDILKPGTVER